MSPRSVLPWLGWWILSLTACATRIPVSLDFDPAIDFKQLHTYAWTREEPPPTPPDPLTESDTLLRQRVESAVDAELRVRGYRKTFDTVPDFWVAYHATTQRKMDVIPYQASFGYGGWWRPYYWGVAYAPSYYVREYDERILVLDMLDGKTRKLIWRAKSRYAVDEETTPQEKTARTWQAVQRMLQGFPPGRMPP